jgi:group I intron endonuclease
MIIYLIRNTVNDKLYIGQTKHSAARRWKTHVYAANRNNRKEYKKGYLQRAIRKYGEAAFEVAEVGTADTAEELNLMERQAIEQLGSNDSRYGYNLTDGGGAGFKFSPETLARMSLKRGSRIRMYGIKSWVRRSAVRVRRSKGRLGKNPSMETKINICAMHRICKEKRLAPFMPIFKTLGLEFDESKYNGEVDLRWLPEIVALRGRLNEDREV